MSTILENLSEEEQAKLLAELEAKQKFKKDKQKSDRKAYKQLAREYVERNIDELVSHNEITGFLIQKLFDDYNAVRAIKTSVYGDKNQDSHTSTIPDGSASITIGHNVTIGFDGTESSGVEKIKNFIKSLSTDDEDNKKLASIVDTYLSKNKKTEQLNPSKIIDLNKLREKFKSEEFNDGLDIIINAQHRIKNSMYVSGYKWIEIEGKPKKMEFRFTV